uniref:Uncharacterized protein n=1 Tax=Setaria viridis TaxID=4556 RepID=A0A4U6SV61_SETVI|nr:hypothetical protein SEVIR_9G133200v2 [Setaria viridis]
MRAKARSSNAAAGRFTHAVAPLCDSTRPRVHQLLLNAPRPSVSQLPAVKLRCAAVLIHRPPSPNPRDVTTPEVEFVEFSWRWTAFAKCEVPLLLKRFSEELTFVDPRNPAGTHRRGSPEDLGYLMSLMIL